VCNDRDSGYDSYAVFDGEQFVWNQPPVADAGGPYAAPEGNTVTFDASGSSDPDGDPLQYRWDFDSNGVWDTAWSTNPTAQSFYDDDHYSTATVEVSDGEEIDTDTASVEIYNVAPTAYAGGPYSGDEASSIGFTGSASDPGSDTHEYRWNIDGSWTAWSADPSASYTWDDDYSGSVTLEVRDDDGGVGSASADVDVYNVAPTVEAGADQTVYSGSAVGASGTYSDPGADTHVAEIAWGDGEVDSIDPAESPVTGSYTYYPIGVYTVTITVTDDDGGVGYDSFDVTVERLPVAIDIKPGSDPNSLNREKKNGRTPVAIINDGTIDPADVNPETVVFAGASPVHWALEDVDGDGDVDMILHFLTQETDIALDSVSATLEADLYDGTQITGEDSVRIVPPNNASGGSDEGTAANDSGNNGKKKDKGK